MEEISLEEYLSEVAPKQRRAKYGNKKTTVDGYTFDSLAEARRYRELKQLEAAGEIDTLRIHPVYILLPAFEDTYNVKHQALTYKADFSYFDHTTESHVAEDVKGKTAPLTDVFKIKRKLLAHFRPDVELRIIRR